MTTLRCALALALTSLLLPCSVAAADTAGARTKPRAPKSKRASAEAASPAPPASRFEWPGDGRAALELPADAWKDVLATGGFPQHALGFSAEEMRNYGRDAHLLRTVETQFRDARGLPRFSGRITDEMLAAAAPQPSLAELVRLGYVLTDIASARMYPGPTAESWGVDWIPADTAPAAALQLALARTLPVKARLSPADAAAVAALPAPVARALARMLAGADAATPWLDLAFEGLPLPKARSTVAATQDALYRVASAPWKDEANDQVATLSKASFDLLKGADREYLAYGSVVFLLHAGLAVEELRAWAATQEGAAALAPLTTKLAISTRFGTVRVRGAGDDLHDAAAFIDLDLGGTDRWTARSGVPASPSRLSIAVDLAGDDTWDSGKTPVALGCGLFGVGVVLDCAGNDTWRVQESGLGAAWFGTGVAADFAGDDRWSVAGEWGQGAAHAGVGLLLDLAGNDAYDCAQQSQGLGSTLGAGLLIDVAGNDAYVARDDGNVSPLYLNQSVAMAQGCGYGRRADLGDGHSLAGGFGVLVDGAGDDSYHSQVWSQGAGYWWSVGILEDRSGNDTYENGKYSAGAGAHFAIGCFVDLTGDDKYNVGVESAVNQYHAHARDGSIGVAIDGDGNDQYFFRNHCGGSADLDSVGLFWDRRGDDQYVVSMKELGPPNGWNETPPMGSATWYPPYRSWRDDIPTMGVFLDSGGKDTHSEGSPGSDDRAWTRPHAPASFGVGMDAEWYPPKAAPAAETLDPATSAPK